MNLELKDKFVFISASSNGIGKSIAKRFLDEGAYVAINGRDEETLRQVENSFNTVYGDKRCISFAGDMSNEQEVKNIINDIELKWKKLDVLVCNLGSGKSQNSDKYYIEEWRRLFDINLFGNVLAVDNAKGLLKKAFAPNIVMVSSLVSFDGIGAPPAYAAAKAGVNSMIKYLSDDLAIEGIRVNGVAPGNVYYKGGRWEELRNADPEGTDKYIDTAVPMRRFGKPEEIADAVVFLASARASFITGTVLKVDGGQSRGY